MDSGTGKKSTHILLLEDDRAHQDLVLRAFRGDPEQFRVSVAATVREARQVLEQDLPDLIIADWILPDGKGLDILPRMDGRVTIPLIIMTSYGDEHLAVEIMKSGAIDYVVKSATMFKDLPHTALRALHEWENIRERKRAETAVQETQKRLADIIGFLPDAMLAIDTEGRVIAWNEAIERMTGVAAADMLGKGDYAYSIPFYGERRPILIDLVLTEEPEIEKKYLTIQRDGDRITSEIFIPTLHDGRGAYLWGTATLLYDSAGNRTGAIEVIRDITDRKRMEDLLIKRDATLETLLNAPNDTIALLDRQGILIGSNTEGARRLGGTVQEVTGRCAYDLLPPDVAKARKDRIDQVFATGKPAIFEDSRNGMYLHNEVFPVFNPEHSAVDQVAVFARDITAQKKTEQALEESEKKYRFLVDNVRDVLWQATLDLTFTYISPAAETQIGYPPEDLIGTSLFDILTEPSARSMRKRLRERTEEYSRGSRDVSTAFEAEIIKKDGSTCWFEVSSNPIFGPDGNLAGFQGISRDINERKQAEEKLLESEDRYRNLVQGVPDYILVHRMGTILYVNAALAGALGYSPEEMIGSSIMPFVAPEDHPLAVNMVRKRVEGDSIPPYGLTILTRDGYRLITEVRGALIQFDGSTATLNVLTDITDRTKAEEKLRKSEEKYHRLYDSMMDAYVSVEMGGRITLFNEPFQKIVGYGKEEIYTLTYNDLTPDKWHTMEADIVKNQILTRGYSEIYEKEYRRKDGTVIPVELRTFLLKDDAGNPQGMSAIVRDITERKRGEEKLRESEERYRALLNGAGIGVGYWSTDGTLLLLNEISLKRLKGTEKDFIGKAMRELFAEEADMYLDRIRKASLSPHPMEYEDYISLPIGKGWYLSVYTRITRPDGSVMGIQVLSMDITERKRDEEIRNAYEARLDSAMEIGSLAWWEMDLPDGAVRFDNRKAAMLGFAPEKFRHYSDFTALLHHEDYEPAMQAMKDHLEGRETRYHTDYRILTAAGDYRWLRDVGGITRRYPDGSPATITGIVFDITASKQAEEALRATEIRFRSLIQNSSDIIRIIDRDGLIVYESESSERILGYPTAYLIGKNPMEYIHPEDLEHVKADFRDVIERKNSGTPTEFRIRKADGEYIWVDSIGTNLLDVPGVNGIVITTRPIQQRKEAEQTLQENEARLATAMDIAGLVNWEYDVATGMFTFNDRFYALYETTADREGGILMPAETYMREFVYPDDRPAVLESIQKILATTDPAYSAQLEHRITPRDGSVRTIFARFAPIMGPDGKVIRTFGANQDITDFKLMESEIRSLNTALEQRVRDRTEALSRANEALEAEIVQREEAEKKLHASYDEKVMLLKEIHHRVKNNLQIVASLLNLQSRYITDSQTLAAIRESQNRVKAMALVHERLYRTEDISHISLHDYIRFLGTGLFQFYDAKSRGIRFTLEIQDINVDIDAAIPLGLILNELISNSLKYAFPEGKSGEISISVKKDNHILTVLYHDTGIGIPAELDWRNTPSLGLRLVTTLVDQLDGTVDLDRTCGTQFTMVLHEKEQKGPS
jgi:PAS domain S-box-containing protein